MLTQGQHEEGDCGINTGRGGGGQVSKIQRQLIGEWQGNNRLGKEH